MKNILVSYVKINSRDSIEPSSTSTSTLVHQVALLPNITAASNNVGTPRYIIRAKSINDAHDLDTRSNNGHHAEGRLITMLKEIPDFKKGRARKFLVQLLVLTNPTKNSRLF